MPSELGTLVNLRELHLHRNQLSRCVPDSPEDQVSYSGPVGVAFCPYPQVRTIPNPVKVTPESA